MLYYSAEYWKNYIFFYNEEERLCFYNINSNYVTRLEEKTAKIILNVAPVITFSELLPLMHNLKCFSLDPIFLKRLLEFLYKECLILGI